METSDNRTLFNQIIKCRKYIAVIFIFVFISVASASYYYFGRTYSAGVEFYFFKSSFENPQADNNIMLAKDELEIIKSISMSDQLYNNLITSKNLLKHYNKKYAYQGCDVLRKTTAIQIDEHGKISITVEDADPYFAYRLANDMKDAINNLYKVYLKSFKNNQILKCDQEITHYNAEKQNIIRTFSKYPSSLLNLKYSNDSLNGPNFIKKINKYSVQNDVKVTEVITVLNLFNRWNKVDEQIYLYSDQKQQLRNALYMLDRNHIFVINKNIQFKRTVEVFSHFLLAFKAAFLAVFLFVLTAFVLQKYTTEFKMIFNYKK